MSVNTNKIKLIIPIANKIGFAKIIQSQQDISIPPISREII
jgi:hypothetical protein